MTREGSPRKKDEPSDLETYEGNGIESDEPKSEMESYEGAGFDSDHRDN